MPRRSIKPLAMSIEQGIKVIVSAGIVTPDLPEGVIAPPARPPGLLERWVRKNRTTAPAHADDASPVAAVGPGRS
jgi:uncharacterized membrane protein